MQDIINSRTNCYNFSDTPEGSVIRFDDSIEPTDIVIGVEPSAYPPYILYAEWKFGNTSTLYYQWCGPMMILFRVFAKRANARLVC